MGYTFDEIGGEPLSVRGGYSRLNGQKGNDVALYSSSSASWTHPNGEPFDSFDDMRSFIGKLRWDYGCFDPVVIYTGFYPDEISNYLMILSKFAGIIVKFGRYIPNQKEHYDELLGVSLANNEQYAVEL